MHCHRMPVLLLFLLCLAGCSTLPGMQNPDLARMQGYPPVASQTVPPVLVPITATMIRRYGHMSPYRVAPADVLAIAVWQHPELSPATTDTAPGNIPGTQGAAGRAGFLIDGRGNIHYPLVQMVPVAGKTTEQIQADLTRRLAHWLRHPSVSVRVSDFRSRKIYVLGEVRHPGIIPFNDQPLSITDALLMSGSLDTAAADPAHIYVIRGNAAKPVIFWLNARTPDALLLGRQFVLQAGDIVFVSSAPAARWNRIINQLLPTVQTLWYTRAIVETG